MAIANQNNVTLFWIVSGSETARLFIDWREVWYGENHLR